MSLWIQRCNRTYIHIYMLKSLPRSQRYCMHVMRGLSHGTHSTHSSIRHKRLCHGLNRSGRSTMPSSPGWFVSTMLDLAQAHC